MGCTLPKSLVGSVSLLTLAIPMLAIDFATIPIQERLATVERLSSAIEIDGLDSDWAQLPSYPDAAGDANGDDSRDIVLTRAVANDAGFFVCLRTLGKPSRDNYAFGFQLDITGLQSVDLELSATTISGTKTVRYFPPGAASVEVPIEGIKFAIRDAVEWFVPWSSLVRALPSSITNRITGPDARPWLRVTPYTWNVADRRNYDRGGSAACFRVPLQTLDLPLPEQPPEILLLPSMAVGQCYIISGAKQGPFGAHPTGWAYDIGVYNSEHFPSSPPQSTNDSDYYAFGRELLAPVPGKIVAVRDTAPDNPPQCSCAAGSPSNYAFLQNENHTLWFVHNRMGSLKVSSGQTITPGQILAEMGNSGPNAWPALHFQVQSGTSETNLIAVALKNVRVSLNSGPNDFWARDLAAWNIEEGYFVEAAPPRIVSMQVSGRNLTVASTTQPGASYQLERTDRIPTAGSWTEILPAWTGTGEETSQMIEIPPAHDQSFFRILRTR